MQLFKTKNKMIKLLALVLVLPLLFSCSSKSATATKETAKVEKEAGAAEGDFSSQEIVKPIDTSREVYFLNWKPEIAELWKNLASVYTDETGIRVNVETIKTTEYFDTLSNKLNSDNPPSLFMINGNNDVTKYVEYCYDLKNTEIYKNLLSDSFALKHDKEVVAIPFTTESYGIIVNKNLLKKAGYDVKDITSFDTLQDIAEDISSRQEQLGFTAFTSASLEKESAWRFNTHLMNLPIYFEYVDDNIVSTKNIKGKYLDNLKIIWDLYINNSTTEPDELANKTLADSRQEFLDDQAVFYQNGSWEYNVLVEDGFTDDEIAIIPIYMGVGAESKQGLCTGTENYWCVNKKAKAADIEATLDFINWCVTSPTGSDVMANDMGLICPYKKAILSSNVFFKQDREYLSAGKKPVAWYFTTIPSEEWKHKMTEALIVYSKDQSPENWENLKKQFVEIWAEEYK